MKTRIPRLLTIAALRGDHSWSYLPPASRVACGTPTTGLHPSDVERLMKQLDTLVNAGNTVIVVEHDMHVAAASDWIIDMGPGAGDEGGRIAAAGLPRQVASAKDSRTAPYLAHALGGRGER